MRPTTFARIPYKPEPVPTNPADLPRYLDNELNRIAGLMQLMSLMHLDPIASPPAKPVMGDVVYADGTAWDPAGSGEGFYYYNSHGVWTPLG